MPKAKKVDTPPYPLVYVRWLDHKSDVTWATETEVDAWLAQQTVVHEVGWLLREDKDIICICSQIMDDDNPSDMFGNRTMIMRKNILELKPL